MTNKEYVVFKIRFKWWLKPYLHTLAFFCKLHNCEPDFEKLKKIVEKGTVIELI
jgi:hypothetical protein